MSVIDLSPALKKIRRRYPKWWRSEAAIRCLRQLWAGAPCNDCGVFEDYETIRIGLDAQKQWYAQIRLTAAPNGWHAVATSYSYPLGGGGSCPSVWNRTAFTSRDEAIAQGLKDLTECFERVRLSAHAPEAQASHATRMKAVISVPNAETKQKIEEHRRQTALNPNRRGPKSKRKPGAFPGPAD